MANEQYVYFVTQSVRDNRFFTNSMADVLFLNRFVNLLFKCVSWLQVWFSPNFCVTEFQVVTSSSHVGSAEEPRLYHHQSWRLQGSCHPDWANQSSLQRNWRPRQESLWGHNWSVWWNQPRGLKTDFLSGLVRLSHMHLFSRNRSTLSERGA